jgi:heme exporter protein A
MYLLKANNICKYYSRTLLFKDVSFELAGGDVLAVTGWNGSGKSTLMRIIAGLIRPSSGSVSMFFQDERVAADSRRRFVGMVAPALSLYDELTAIENMVFFCKVRGVNSREDTCRDMLRLVGLEQHAHKLSGRYSSGMKQRLKLAQALVHHPPLLLLDEPGTNLDSKGMQIVRDIIAKQKQWGMTIIASNEKREIDYADRIINLSE